MSIICTPWGLPMAWWLTCWSEMSLNYYTPFRTNTLGKDITPFIHSAMSGPVGWDCRMYRLWSKTSPPTSILWPCWLGLQNITTVSLQRSKPISQRVSCGPVSCGCRIHRLHLSRGVRLSKRVFCIWLLTIWWRGSSNTEALGNAE